MVEALLLRSRRTGGLHCIAGWYEEHVRRFPVDFIARALHAFQLEPIQARRGVRSPPWRLLSPMFFPSTNMTGQRPTFQLGGYGVIVNSASPWIRVPPHEAGWSQSTSDPDFYVDYIVRTHDYIRIERSLVLDLALCVVGKPLAIETMDAIPGLRRVRVTLGLTALAPIARWTPMLSRPAIAMLTRLVACERYPIEAGV